MRPYKRHYRIIDKPNQQQKQKPSPFPNRKQLQKLTKSLLKQHKFMYIDINEDSGYKLMEQCEQSDDQDQVESIGKRYTVNLNNLYTTNSKGLTYIYKFKEQIKKKDHTLKLLEQEIQRSTEKIQCIAKARTNQHINQINLYANKTAFSRYETQKQSKQTVKSNEKTNIPAFFVTKNPRLYQTISFDKTTKQILFSPRKKKEVQITPFSLKNILPDIKKYRKNLRI